jgi:hypothetical protein
MDIETLAYAQNEGYNTFYARPSQYDPERSVVIREMLAGNGADSEEIFTAFRDGYHHAAHEECTRIFAEV